MEEDNFTLLQIQKHPSRCQQIGELQCYFASWYRNGSFPIFSIGPSRIGAGIMFVMATTILSIMIYFVSSIDEIYISIPLYICVLINFYLFLKTMFGDCGVDESIYKRYIAVANEETAENITGL